LNLGIAILNQQKAERTEEVEKHLRRAAELDPRNPRPHYCLAMWYAYLSREEEAVAELQAVLALDPDDPDTLYSLGQMLSRLDRGEEARSLFERAVARDPLHASAWYGLGQNRLRSGDREAGMEAMERFQSLTEQGIGRARSQKYTEMGKYAEVERLNPAMPREAPLLPVSFVAVEEGGIGTTPGTGGPLPLWQIHADRDSLARFAANFGPGVVAADFDGDDDPDVAIAAKGPGGVRLLRNEKGRVREVSGDSSLGEASLGMGVYAGDFDNDGDRDLYVTCFGPNRFFRNDGKGKFADETAASGASGGDRWSLGAALSDLDQDGDLDVYVANFADLSAFQRGDLPGAPNLLLVNRGDGTFDDATEWTKVGGGAERTLGALASDLDGDGDPDLLALGEGNALQYWRNDRVLAFTPTSLEGVSPPGGRARGALAEDVDRDGVLDLVLLHGEGASAWRNLGRGRFERDGSLEESLRGAAAAAFFDADNDGSPDLFVAGEEPRLSRRRATGFTVEKLALADVGAARSLVPADFDGDGDLDLFLARAGAAPLRLRNEGGSANGWIAIRPKGVRSGGAGMGAGGELRSPAQGIGAQVEVKAEFLLASATLGGGSGYLCGGSDVLHFGLGPHSRADYVRILWPDGVLQAELDVAGRRVVTIEELQRKASSCPLLFAWDGERFAFVTDFLGVGGLGFLVEPGVYSPPDPDEVVRIPFPLVPHEGALELRIAEPLEEVTYADRLALLVWDHPGDVEVYPDERFAASLPLPTGRPIAVRETVFPVSARDDSGRERRDDLLRADRVEVGPTALDPLFLGYAVDHALELDFGEEGPALAHVEGPVYLFARGWIEYPYSRINLGAHQAGRRMRAPSIEVPDGDGGWRVPIGEFGYPAGLPRTMAVEVGSALREGAGRMRIRTNLEVHWDQVFLARPAQVPLRETELAPAEATLRFLGYPREYSPDGRPPRLYDYSILDRGFPFFRNQAGDYTRFGDVRELLLETDDRFVVFGRGDEVTLRFDPGALPELPAGWSRTFALRAEGYCKDMDPCTARGESVEPFPFRAMSNYPPPPGEAPANAAALEADRAIWNTRRVR
jgi:tetratricopeptide (TPR) repeat protein